MKKNHFTNFFLLFSLLCIALESKSTTVMDSIPSQSNYKLFPKELISFGLPSANAVFSGTKLSTWDRGIRERGWIMKEGALWSLWYTGYNSDSALTKFLGYASSQDGLHWTRNSTRPLNTTSWIEDVCVVKRKNKYYLFSEGMNDIAHWLVSTDKIHWEEKGELIIYQTSGELISKGPRGTPTVLFNAGKWWLFYERDDKEVFVATSKDLKYWTNVTDTPILNRGPSNYDRYAVAIDQIIQYKGHYYAYYHASDLKSWGQWSTCIARSDDLIHWIKFSGNPILPVNPTDLKRSSGLLIQQGKKFLFYTMHPDIRVHLPKQ